VAVRLFTTWTWNERRYIALGLFPFPLRFLDNAVRHFYLCFTLSFISASLQLAGLAPHLNSPLSCFSRSFALQHSNSLSRIVRRPSYISHPFIRGIHRGSASALAGPDKHRAHALTVGGRRTSKFRRTATCKQRTATSLILHTG
jgi:hypothetical protein